MKILILKRLYGQDNTLGNVITEEGNILIKTLELPDLDNEPNKSCIPEGEYICKWILSNKLGWVYRLQNVEGRTCIDIHSGNLTSQILGCLLVGSSYGKINGEFAILDSKNSLTKLFNYAGSQFQLNIVS